MEGDRSKEQQTQNLKTTEVVSLIPGECYLLVDSEWSAFGREVLGVHGWLQHHSHCPPGILTHKHWFNKLLKTHQRTGERFIGVCLLFDHVCLCRSTLFAGAYNQATLCCSKTAQTGVKGADRGHGVLPHAPRMDNIFKTLPFPLRWPVRNEDLSKLQRVLMGLPTPILCNKSLTASATFGD